MATKSRYLAYTNRANQQDKKTKKSCITGSGSRKASILGKMQHMKGEKNNG